MNEQSKFNEVKIRHVVIMYLISILIITIIMFFLMITHDGNLGNETMNILNVLMECFILIMLIIKFKITKSKVMFLYNDAKKKIDMKEIIKVIFFRACIAIGGSQLIIGFFYIINSDMLKSFMEDTCLIINTKTDCIMTIILLVILAPLIEELIFRGVLFKRLSKKFNIYVGIIVSSIIFASLHVGPGIIGAFAFGIINCIMYIKYNNIFIPMFIHFINNVLISVLLIPILNNNVYEFMFNKNNVYINIINGILLFIVGLIYLFKFIKKNKLCLSKCENIMRV